MASIDFAFCGGGATGSSEIAPRPALRLLHATLDRGKTSQIGANDKGGAKPYAIWPAEMTAFCTLGHYN